MYTQTHIHTLTIKLMGDLLWANKIKIHLHHLRHDDYLSSSSSNSFLSPPATIDMTIQVILSRKLQFSQRRRGREGDRHSQTRQYENISGQFQLSAIKNSFPHQFYINNSQYKHLQITRLNSDISFFPPPLFLILPLSSSLVVLNLRVRESQERTRAKV